SSYLAGGDPRTASIARTTGPLRGAGARLRPSALRAHPRGSTGAKVAGKPAAVEPERRGSGPPVVRKRSPTRTPARDPGGNLPRPSYPRDPARENGIDSPPAAPVRFRAA